MLSQVNCLRHHSVAISRWLSFTSSGISCFQVSTSNLNFFHSGSNCSCFTGSLKKCFANVCAFFVPCYLHAPEPGWGKANGLNIANGLTTGAAPSNWLWMLSFRAVTYFLRRLESRFSVVVVKFTPEIDRCPSRSVFRAVIGDLESAISVSFCKASLMDG